jgi:hypothetical protein
MTNKNTPVPGSKRVQNHRKRDSLNKLKRVEVKVSEKDVPLIRSVAELLKSDEEKANSIRNNLSELLFPGSEQSLVDFFRSSPLVEASEVLDIERSKDTGSPLNF